MGGDRRPDISSSQSFVDRPYFVQYPNAAVGLNKADEMDASIGDRQRLGDKSAHLTG